MVDALARLPVVILAAGIGSRLGRPHPKPLTELANGQTILARQISSLRAGLHRPVDIFVVVGFKHTLIMESFPDVLFAYNERFDTTNTAKSLLRGMTLAAPGGVLWLNGDVVFAPSVVETLIPHLDADHSFMCVRRCHVGEEEVGFLADTSGVIQAVGKKLSQADGEAIGINYVSSRDRGVLTAALSDSSDQDYFERAVQDVIKRGARVDAVDLGGALAVEVDFVGDLALANRMIHDHQDHG